MALQCEFDAINLEDPPGEVQASSLNTFCSEFEARGSHLEERWKTLTRTLAYMVSNEGELSAAQARFEDALSIAREIVDRRTECMRILEKGDYACNDLRDCPKARRCFEEALSIAREVGDRHAEGQLIGNLGIVAFHLGEYLEARVRMTEALGIARELADRGYEGWCVASFAYISAKDGSYLEVATNFERALSIFREIGDRDQEVFWVAVLGDITAHLGDYPEVEARLEGALRTASNEREGWEFDPYLEWLAGLSDDPDLEAQCLSCSSMMGAPQPGRTATRRFERFSRVRDVR
jgi:tetratricopeptide (TPR) repeat protein